MSDDRDGEKWGIYEELKTSISYEKDKRKHEIFSVSVRKL